MKSKLINIKKQAGLTLVEVIVGLVIFALIVGGALSLYNSANSSQSSTQLSRDIQALRVAVKSVYGIGQGSFGTTNMNNVLVTANKVPATMNVDTSTTPNTITHALNGTVNIVGATTTFTITTTNISSDVCTTLMSTGQGWTSIKAGSAAARTPPVAPATAAADCGAAATATMIFTSN